MKKITIKKNPLFWATVISVLAIVIISLVPLLNFNFKNQEARIVNAKESKNINQKKMNAVPTKTNDSLKDISGKRIIGISFIEDFTKEKISRERTKEGKLKSFSSEIKQEIFIDGKSFEFMGDGINLEMGGGVYEVKGSLNTKTNIVNIENAKFLGEVFDGVNQEDSRKIEDSKGNAISLSASKKVQPKKVAVFLVNYTDTQTTPFSTETIDNMMFGDGKFAKYFDEASYGRQSISGDVFGWYTLPRTSTSGCQASFEDMEPFLQANQQVNLNNYGNILMLSLCEGGTVSGFSNTSPQPYIINGETYNKTATWVNISGTKWNQISDQMIESMQGEHIFTNLERLLIHEFGHAMGLPHADATYCQGLHPNQNCTNLSTGNYYDTMAYETVASHFNAWSKEKLGWFNTNELKTITSSGTYTITPLEKLSVGMSPLNSAKAYKIKPSNNSEKTPIWIEFRKGIGFDLGLNTQAWGGLVGGGGEAPPHNIKENEEGIFIYKEGFKRDLGGQLNSPNARLMYLRSPQNSTIGSTPNPYQVSLNPGQTYSEPRYGLTIKTLNSVNENARRFQVLMDSNFACTSLSPSLELWSAPPTSVVNGSSFNTWIVLTNMDYLSCPRSSFRVTLGDNTPNGISINNPQAHSLNGFISNLKPDDERIFNTVITVSGTSSGQHIVPIVVTNMNSGESKTLNVPINIQ